jgi:Flp pilus assembly protein TadG
MIACIRSSPSWGMSLGSLARRALSGAVRSGVMLQAAGLWRNRCGSTAIVFALSMPVLIGGIGLGVEVTNWYLIQRSMQNASDAAVLAATSNGGSNYDVEGKAVAAQLGWTHGVNNVTVTVQNNVACPSGGTTCYSATITNQVALFLAPVLGYGGTGASGKQNLAVTSIATKGTIQREYCILALAPQSSSIQDFTSNGGPKANLAGCSIKSNADATCNGHDLNADFGDAVGTSSGCGSAQNSGVPPSADPYADKVSNIPADTCSGSYPQAPSHHSDPDLPESNLWTGTKNLSGNVQICGDLQLTGNVTINAPSNAVLVIQNGKLDLNGYTLQTASGSGLTVVFSGTVLGDYTHAPTGSGTLDIQAPTSGAWSGVALYQDPKLTTGVNISEAGNSPTWKITGLVYLPKSSVTMSGAINKSSNGASCFAMVAYTVTINGTGAIASTGGCAAAGLTMPTGAVPARGILVN